jgi:GT2 family glycosyltransferase
MGRGECHIVRAEPFWRVGGYDERLYAGEDFDLYRRLRRLGRI